MGARFFAINSPILLIIGNFHQSSSEVLTETTWIGIAEKRRKPTMNIVKYLIYFIATPPYEFEYTEGYLFCVVK